MLRLARKLYLDPLRRLHIARHPQVSKKNVICSVSKLVSFLSLQVLLSAPIMPVAIARVSSGNAVSKGPEEVKVQFPGLPKEMQQKYVKGQMYKFQDSLPKLPVPPLQQTLSKYLAGIKVGTKVWNYSKLCFNVTGQTKA